MRTASHRGQYGRKSKGAASVPLLLRRALAQLRGEDPTTWPNRNYKPWMPDYPVPRQLNHIGPVAASLRAEATRELRMMLERTERAAIGHAWAAVDKSGDDGSAVLLALISALQPVTTMDAAKIGALLKSAKAAASRLAASLTALREGGAQVAALLPVPGAGMLRAFPKGHARGYVQAALTDPVNLLAMVEHIARFPSAKIRQRRGELNARRAIIIGRALVPALGSEHAAMLANAATGARITSRALTKKAELIPPESTEIVQ